jgi:hypothetical protein
MKSLVKTLTAAAVLTMALAGCASKAGTGTDSAAAGNGNPPAVQTTPGTGATSGDGSTPTSGSSSGGVQAPAPTHPSQSPVSPTKPGAATTDQVKYTSPDGITVSADGRVLATPIQWGGCTEEPQLLVTAQDASQVVVELKTVTHFRMGAMCPNIARAGEASATLNAPLGNRQLIDAVTHAVIRTH